MTVRERLLNWFVKFLLFATSKIDAAEMKEIPKRGPAVLISNHTSNIEGPLYFVLLRPRKVTALGKKELWDSPITRVFMDTWNIIKLNRASGDLEAIRNSFKALDNGYILGIAPEGTRSKNGKLKKGKAGTTFIATKRRVPVIPMVQWGLHNIMKNLKKLQQTRVNIRVGRPFYLEKKDGSRINAEDRRKMADEMMYQLAVLLPEKYRGAYSNLSKMSTDYITFIN